MADLAGLAAALMQRNQPNPNAMATAATGWQRNRDRDTANVLMQLAKQSQAATDDYQRALTEQQRFGMEEAIRTRPMKDAAAQANIQQDLAKVQSEMAGARAKNYDTAHAQTFTSLNQAVSSGNALAGLSAIKNGIEQGVLPQEALQGFAKAKDKTGFAKSILGNMYQDAKYRQQMDLENLKGQQRIAEKNIIAPETVKQVDLARAAMLKMIQQYGDKVREMPEFQALADVVNPIGMTSRTNTEVKVNATALENAKKNLEKVKKSAKLGRATTEDLVSAANEVKKLSAAKGMPTMGTTKSGVKYEVIPD